MAKDDDDNHTLLTKKTILIASLVLVAFVILIYFLLSGDQVIGAVDVAQILSFGS